MSTNDVARLQATLDDLNRQFAAAVRRQHDLADQHKAVQDELNKLGFLQMARKKLVRAEADSLATKLAANQQLQELLKQRIADAQAQLDAASAPVDAPAPVDEPALVDEPAPVDAPAPVDEPAPVHKPRPAGPRRTTPRAARAIVDATLTPEEQATHLLAHLERYYPEHQLFAPEVLTADTRALLATLAENAGSTVADFLCAHGWRQVTLAQGRELRRAACPAPGGEPAIIQPKLASVLSRMERHYPDRVITRSIQHDHKALAQDVTALSAYLGYASPRAMLTAYGFHYDVPTSGRPGMNVEGIIAALKTAYAGQEKPRTIAAIAADHPEYAAVLKTLQNQAPKRFGMSLRQYFRAQGLM